MSLRWLTRTPVLSALLLLVLLGVGLVLERIETDRQRLRARAAVQSQLETLRDRLHSQLNADLQLVRGLASVMILEPDLDQARFERAVQPLLQGRTHLRNVAAAPDMVVRLVTPLAGNEAVVGLAYDRLPEQAEAAWRARDTRQLVLAGPLQLLQGGVGLVARMPVFVEQGGQERFWGLVSAVLDVDRLFDDAGLRAPGLPIELAIRGVDGRGQAGSVFFGEADLFERDTLRIEVELPAGAWQMAAQPLGGWAAADASRWPLRLAYAAAATLVIAVFAALVRALRSASLSREQAEAARRQLAAVLEGAPDAMLLVDEQGRVERANSQAERLFGRPRHDLVGHPVERLMPEASRQRHQGLRDAYLRGSHGPGVFRTAAMVGVRADGTQLPIEIMLSPLQVDGRRLIAASVRDITERKAVEAELERHRTQLEAQVEQRTAQLAAAKDAAEAANVSKTRFLANMSHEIRTPLNAISGMAYLIRQSGVSPEQRQRLDTLETASRHLLGVIDTILDLSKIESGRLELVSAVVDPRAVVEGVAALVRESARAKGLELLLELPPELPALRGDATRLQQALLNYAANAVRFTGRGRVVLGLALQQQTDGRCELRFEVRDTGPGIGAETMARLFQPFEQADNTSTRPHGGTGLGLVITRRLAQLMGGDAGAESRPGEGSRFWFSAWLDRADPVSAQPDSGVADSTRLRVLLAEDDAVNRVIATHLLQDLAHGVDSAEDGEQALAMAAQADYDLILMDVQMPRMDGLEATRRIRALPGHGHTRIIAITANAFERDRQACLEAGMDGFITKPIDPVRLREVLRGAPDTAARPGPVSA